MKSCPACGKDVSDIHRFCPSCGKSIENFSVPPQGQVAAAAPAQAPAHVALFAPKRAGRMAFRTFLFAFGAYIVCTIATKMQQAPISLFLCFGIGAAYAIFTLKKWRSTQNQPVDSINAARIWIGVMILFAVSGLVGTSSSHRAPISTSTSSSGATFSPVSSTADTSTVSPTADTVPSPTASRWTYQDHTDEMRGTTSHMACTDSTNTLQFEFPYNGGSTANLCFRRRGSELNAWIAVDKGQFMCGIDSCSMAVKFDDGSLHDFRMSEPDSHDSKVLFFDNESSLLSDVKSARHVKVEGMFFQEGRRVMEFDVAGLDWK